MNKTLVSLDSKGKVRVVEISYDWSPTDNGFVIRRITGQLGGKQTQQPDILVERGKAGRTVTEQTVLQFNSHLKKYLDKGYKEWEDILDEAKIKEALGDIKTGQDGMIKPMLAKQADKVANKFFDREWYASRKIDGCRCLMYYKNDEIHTASRGGGHYDYSTDHITKHPLLISWFNNNQNIILDGELFRMGKSLQQISGAARLEVNAYDCDWLEYYIYDIFDLNNPNLIFSERLNIINNLKNQLSLNFIPEKDWSENELQIQIVPHVKVSGWDSIQKLHNKYVLEGWEGVVLRDPNKPYQPGARNNSMIKVKNYRDSEFKIINYELGLRGVEDMVFVCETVEGNLFKAKPMGNKELKQWYVDNFEENCLNHLAKIKFFYYSNGDNEVTGVPLQPTMIEIRDKTDL